MSGFVDKPEAVEVPGLVHLHTGKVRDLYQNEAGELEMVASDRTSAYDWVLPTEIPDKGRVLTRLSMWWFDQLADLVPNHVLSTDVPARAPAAVRATRRRGSRGTRGTRAQVSEGPRPTRPPTHPRHPPRRRRAAEARPPT